MAVIPLATGDWGSVSENVPRHRLRNMYLIENPLSPDGISRVSRPSLTSFITVGNGPIYGIWRQDATLDGDFLVISGNNLYRVTSEGVSTLIGAVTGNGFGQFAGTADRVIIVRDGTAYSTDGNSITTVTMPDDVPEYDGMAAPVGSVAVINNTFLLSVWNTQRYYWIEPGETNPDPLNFASAERIPDAIVSIGILTDEIWFLGSSGPEVWAPTTNGDEPFQRINGRVYSDGCASRDTVASAVFQDLPCLLWVTSTRSVALAQGSVTKISTESEEELLRSATNLRAWSFRHRKHDFYIITANEFTLAFDLERGEWSRWDTYDLDNWRAHLGTMSDAIPYAGDSVNGTIWKLEEGYSDGSDAIIREVSGFIPHSGKPVPCSSLNVGVNAGWSPSYTLEPFLEVRWSDDLGATWSTYAQLSLGDRGHYDTDVTYRSLGLINRPGRVFQFRFSELATFRLDYATINEV